MMNWIRNLKIGKKLYLLVGIALAGMCALDVICIDGQTEQCYGTDRRKMDAKSFSCKRDEYDAGEYPTE